MNKPAIIVIAALMLAFIALLYYSTAGLKQHTVEVCMTFRERTQCRTASGATPEEALRTATDNACAFLASGVGETIACGQTQPTRVTWK